MTFTDADQDGIPLSYDATFNCVGVPAGTSRVTGRVTIADNDDSSATAGLTVTFSSFVIAVGTSAGAVGRTLDGTMALVPGPNGTFTATQNLTTTFPSTDPSTVGALDVYVSKETATYTPTSAADPFSSGTVNLGGSGKLTATFNGDKQNKDVSRSSNPVLHSNALPDAVQRQHRLTTPARSSTASAATASSSCSSVAASLRYKPSRRTDARSRRAASPVGEPWRRG